jgi:hypothetical protein
MTSYTRKIALLAAVSLVGLLAIGAASACASACGGPGGGKGDDDLGFAIATSRTKTVASNLGITVAALNRTLESEPFADEPWPRRAFHR